MDYYQKKQKSSIELAVLSVQVFAVIFGALVIIRIGVWFVKITSSLF